MLMYSTYIPDLSHPAALRSADCQALEDQAEENVRAPGGYGQRGRRGFLLLVQVGQLGAGTIHLRSLGVFDGCIARQCWRWVGVFGIRAAQVAAGH